MAAAKRKFNGHLCNKNVANELELLPAAAV